MERFEIQQQAVQLMIKHHRVALQWCTGLGKSKAAIDIINEIKGNKVLLVVAEIAHKDNWRKEFEKWELNTSLTEITLETYASLKNHRKESFDLLILDEGHHAGSELRIDILNDIKAKNVLVLSATLPNDVLFQLQEIYGDFTNYRITLQQAIEWGILPEPKIYLIPMELDNTHLSQSVVEEWGKSVKRKTVKCKIAERWTYLKNKTKYPDLRLEIQCTELQKYIYLTDKAEFWKKQFFRTRNEGVKNKWLQLGSERKRYLGGLKTEKANQLISVIKSKRFICFCSSIEQAEVLGGENSIHSKKKGALNTIDYFNNKEIDSLFAIGMIQEGQNLVDIEVGVIIQLDGQERAFVQKSGRAMRAEEPVLFILYYKNTRDEEYLNKALEDINPEYVTEVTDLNEILI